MRVLLVEDDDMLASAVCVGLARAGITVDRVADGASGIAAARSEPFAAVLLDLGLPRRDGLDVLRELRDRACRVPVIIITARDGVEDRIAGLDAGADDYVAKPFDIDELAARLRAVVRRQEGPAAPVLQAAGMRLDPARREVFVDGRQIALSAREFALLELLLRRPGVPLSRAQIEDQLLGWGEEVVSNAIEVQIHHLRRKVGAERIHNIRGVGYFVPRS
ncbi:response regulator transcription factor [Aquabacterium humicola]|uniref:response regulator transcription factor n=1 Tax=Aquabacterium humicola TaxID=3237377 RepID=UPI002543AE51|nr:response regulator transcription factor [Rubrivivax pictus]